MMCVADICKGYAQQQMKGDLVLDSRIEGKHAGSCENRMFGGT